MGKGYSEKQVVLETESGQIETHTYYATNLSSSELPYTWYKALVVAGAKEHKLPELAVSDIDIFAALEFNSGNVLEEVQELRNFAANERERRVVRISRVAVERLDGQHREIPAVFQELGNNLNATRFSATKNHLVLHLHEVQAFGVNDL